MNLTPDDWLLIHECIAFKEDCLKHTRSITKDDEVKIVADRKIKTIWELEVKLAFHLRNAA